MAEIKKLLKHNRAGARLYIAPFDSKIVTVTFTQSSFMMKNKLHQVMTNHDPGARYGHKGGTCSADFLKFRGNPVQVVGLAQGWYWYSHLTKTFVFTNYLLAYAHAVRCGAIK